MEEVKSDASSVRSIQIFGREYKIKGHADEAYIQEMAQYVDAKMRELSNNSSLPSQERLAILAALNIADELFQERNQTTETFSSIEQRAARMVAMLDEGLLTEK